MRVRLLSRADLDAVVRLAGSAGVGVTTLQPDASRLAERIALSERAVADEGLAGDAGYFFALEDDASGELAGVAAIEAAVGLSEPWYNYRVGLSVHASRELGIYKQLPTLFLTSDLTGSSELCSLFLHPDWRRDGNGALLSKSRFLFMAEFPERFAERVIAEMRGVSDADGRSPFWESLGRQFFTMDFARADFLSYVGSKSFIAELMPRYPIYTALLSQEAQDAIADVHPATKPARVLLEGEGFRYQGYIDIFDAGPTLECSRTDIRAVRQGACFQALAISGVPKGGVPWLVSNRRLDRFCCALAVTRPLEDALPLPQSVLDALDIADGDPVRAVPLSGKE